MEICLICDEHEGWGGIGTYTAVHARGLAALGHRVHVIVRSWEEEHVEERDGVVWHHTLLPEPRWRLGTRTVTAKLFESQQMLRWTTRAHAAVQQIRQTQRLDVVEAPEYHAQGLRPALARSAPPVVIKLHSPAFIVDRFNAAPAGTALDRRVGARLERAAIRAAAQVSAASNALIDRAVGRLPLRRPPAIVPNPIDAELFAPSPLDGHDRHVLFVGRLERIKGVETLIDAVPLLHATVPGLRLTLVGEDDSEGHEGGSMAEHLRSRLSAHGISEETVRIAGAVPRHDLPTWYARATACVVPSRWEGFPFVALEAMSCGRPVVASAVGGLVELIQSGADGLLVPPGDSQKLADAITRLLADRDLARRLGTAARAKVEQRYAQPAACAGAVELYGRVISENG